MATGIVRVGKIEEHFLSNLVRYYCNGLALVKDSVAGKSQIARGRAILVLAWLKLS